MLSSMRYLKGEDLDAEPAYHLTGIKTTPADVCHWAQALVCLHARLAPRFARPEPRRRALAYLQGILSDISRKKVGNPAEHAGEARPDGTVACNEPVGFQTPPGRRREEAAFVEEFVPQLEWQRLSMGESTKGPQL